MQRDLSFDILKCFAIWLMVLGHSNFNSEPAITMIYAFHMPVFFFISGFFFKKRPFDINLKKDLKNLIQPYFIASIMSFTVCWISPTIHPELYPGIEGWLDIFCAAFVGMILMDDTVTTYSFMPSGPLWFLPALFISRVLFSFLLNASSVKKENWAIGLGICCSIGLFFLFRAVHFFSIDSAFLSFPFVAIGYLFSKYKLLEKLQDVRFFPFFLIGCICFYWGAKYNTYVSVDGGLYGNYLILFYINAFWGILLSYYIINLFRFHYEVLAYLGSNSLVVLIFHMYIIMGGKVVYTFLGGNVSEMPVLISLIISIMVMLFCIPVSKLVNDKYSFLVGKK